jgi:hypothetical protein
MIKLASLPLLLAAPAALAHGGHPHASGLLHECLHLLPALVPALALAFLGAWGARRLYGRRRRAPI